MTYKLAFQGTGNYAKALGLGLPISAKHAREICGHIRGMHIEKAKRFLEEVAAIKTPVPFKRFNKDVGHKKGAIAAGRFPVKASTTILTLIKTAEANAQNKGMTITDLVITHILSQKDETNYRYGRRRGITAKKTHVEIILQEKKLEKKERKKKAVKKEVKEKPAAEAAAKPVPTAKKVEEPAKEGATQKKEEKEAESVIEKPKTTEEKVVEAPKEPKKEEKPVEKSEETKQ